MIARMADDHFATFWCAASDGAILTDGRLKVAALNPSAVQILGHPARLTVGQPLRELIDDPDLLGALARGNKTASGALLLDQRRFNWNLLTVPVEGSLAGALLVFSQIGEERPESSSPAATARLQGILTALLDGAYEGITIVDGQGRITLMNQVYCEFLQVRPEDVVGRPVEQVLENTRLPVVLETGVPEYRQVQRMRGHDTICDRIPIRDGDRVVGAVGKVLFRDIAELKDLLDQTDRLQQEVEFYKGQLGHLQGRYSVDGIVGQSRAIVDLKAMIGRAARSGSTVLLRGESGTGKELVSHAIHNASDRRYDPLVKVNCAAIPETLLESELFGYEEGAFTGARKGGRIGKFEQANRGTILLDEIGDMPLGMQSKLLRVLQEREIERVGGTKSIRVDVRVIAATNQDLDGLVASGKFRSDLFYRLNVFLLQLPPLRERREDIPSLVEHLLGKLGKTLGCGRKSVSGDAMEILLAHSWPGNVRELENALERALNVLDGHEIYPRHLPTYLIEIQSQVSALPPLKEAVARTERELLKQSLLVCKGDHLAAARLLGLSKSTYYEKVARYNLR